MDSGKSSRCLSKSRKIVKSHKVKEALQSHDCQCREGACNIEVEDNV